MWRLLKLQKKQHFIPERTIQTCIYKYNYVMIVKINLMNDLQQISDSHNQVITVEAAGEKKYFQSPTFTNGRRW